MATEFHKKTHEQLKSIVDEYHDALDELAVEEQRIARQRALIKATLHAELHDRAAALKLAPDAIGFLAARCL